MLILQLPGTEQLIEAASEGNADKAIMVVAAIMFLGLIAFAGWAIRRVSTEGDRVVKIYKEQQARDDEMTKTAYEALKDTNNVIHELTLAVKNNDTRPLLEKLTTIESHTSQMLRRLEKRQNDG